MSLRKPLPAPLLAAALAVTLITWVVVQASRSSGPESASAPRGPAAAEPATETPALATPLDLAGPAALEAVAVDEGREAVAPETAGRRAPEGDDVHWLEGRVLLPPDMPRDERAIVLSLENAMQLPRIYDTDGPALAAWKEESNDGLLDWTEMDPDGRFRIPVPAEAESAHLAVSGRYLFSKASTQVPLPGIDVELPAELGGWISGRLVPPLDASNDEDDLAEVEVELGPDISAGFNAFELASTAVNQETETDADGNFEFRGVSTTSAVSISARPERLAATRELGIQVAPGQHLALDVSLAHGATLLGQVADEVGRPVAEAKVWARFRGALGRAVGALRETETDERGDYVLAHVTTGTIEVVASHEGYVQAKVKLAPEQLRDGGRLLGIDLVLEAGASIAGRVSFPDGTPAAGAAVTASPDTSQLNNINAMSVDWNSSSTTTADDQGRFQIRGLSNSRFRVRATRDEDAGERSGEWRAVARNVQTDGEPLELVLGPLAVLRGQVVDTAGEPVTAFRVTATLAGTGGMLGIGAERNQQGFKDEPEGSFEMEGLEAGSWEIRVVAAGYATSDEQDVTLPAGEAPLRFVLLAAAGVAGRVLDTAGQPVSGAKVGLHFALADRMEAMQGGGAPTAFTDAEGAFRLEDVDPGSVSLVASLEGFASSAPLPCEVVAGETLEDVILHLRRGGTLTGEVLSSEGEPWPGRMVIAQRMPDFAAQHMMQSDEAGAFRAENLEPGSWQIVATLNFMEEEFEAGDDKYGEFLSNMQMDIVEIVEGEVTHVVLGAPPADPVSVRGRVLHDDEPVAGAMVSFVPEGGEGIASMKLEVADQDGAFEVELDHPGPYLVTVQVIAAMGQQNSIEFTEDIPADQGSVELILELPVGRISGRVLDADGEPLPECRVTLHVEDGMAFGSVLGGQYNETDTDDEGVYDLPNLRPGAYSVAVGGVPMGGLLGGEAKGGRIVRGGLRISEGEHLEGVDFRLEPPAELAGTVLDAGGNPVSGATIFVRDENGKLLERFSFVVTDASGSFTYEGLAEGRYSVIAKEGGRVSRESALVRVSANRRGDVTVALEEGTVVLVTVVDIEKLLRARVRVLDSEGREVTGMWSLPEMMEISRNFSSKEQRVGPLPPGKYTVIVTTEDGRTTKKPVTLRGTGERKLKLRLR